MSAPLAGLKVLDASRVLAGPYAAMMLGDLGAEVIKVERPGTGDQTRVWGPPFVNGESAYYLSINRNKRSLTLNFKGRTGQEIFRRLVLQSDVVIENFHPDTLDKLNLGYQRLEKGHPGLIWCSVTGYGHHSPWKDRPAYDIALQAESGLMSITGEPGRAPVRVGVALVDILTAHHSVQAIQAALLHRERTGEGQWIDMSMLDCGVTFLTYMAQIQIATGTPPGRMGSGHPTIVPYQAFPTRDHYIVVAVGSREIWKRFCQAIRRPELTGDPRFADNARRVENRRELEEIITTVFTQKPLSEWLSCLRSYDVPATPVNDLSMVWQLPPVRERGLCQTLQHPTIGPLSLLASPMKLTRTPPELTSAPPLLGEHTEEILQALQFSEDEIAQFKAHGVV